MSVKADVVNLILNVNGDKAQNQLNELRKRALDLALEMKDLKTGTQKYIDANDSLTAVNAKMKELKQTIGITSLSIKELGQERRRLTAILNQQAPETKEFIDYNNQLQAVIVRQKELKASTQGLANVMKESMFSNLKQQITSLAVAYLGLQAVISVVKGVFSQASGYSDQLADIRRVAGLTSDEVITLKDQLLSIDTRTSLEGLLNIAVVAGKLGVAKDDIYSFTKAVDQLVVTLGDELGNADQITTTLGKILNVFDGKITGENISKLGNAIVGLANNGVATGGFLVDFAQRLSGIAKASNLSLAAVLGLGAGLEETGARVESSSTGIQRLIFTIGGDLPKAAQIAGQDVKKFSELFGDSPQEALLQYAAGLQKNKKAFNDVIASFKDAGDNSVRVQQVLTILGTKTDFFASKIREAGIDLKNTTQITTAFAIKNETLAANLEKIGKAFSGFISSKFVTFFTETLAGGFAKLTNIFQKTSSALDQFKDQAKYVDDLQNSITPLIERVDQLATTTNLSTVEQNELSTAIKTIGESIPVAIVQFDKYGKAIGISTDKAREFIQLQQDILKIKNKSAIEEAAKSLVDLQKQANQQNQFLETYKKQAAIELATIEEVKARGVTLPEEGYKILEVYQKGIAQTSAKLGELQSQINGTQGLINQLSGKDYSNILKPKTDSDENIIDSKSVAARRAFLEKAIEDSKTDYEQLNAMDKAGQQANLTLRAKYQKELEALDNKKEKKQAGDGEHKRLLKEAQDFYKSLKKLKEDAGAADKGQDEKDLVNLEQKYNDLHAKALEYLKKNVTDRKTYTAEEKLIVEAFNQELAALQKKQFEAHSGEEYERAIKDTKEYFDTQRNLEGESYAKGKQSKTQYSAELHALDLQEKGQLVQVAQDYSGTVKKAAEDITKFKKDNLDQQTADDIDAMEKSIKTAQEEALAKAKLAVLAAPDGSKQQVAAKKALARLESEQDLANKNITDKKSDVYLLAEKILQGKLDDIDNEARKKKLDEWDQFGQDLLGITTNLITALNNLDQRTLQKDTALNNAKKNNYKKQLDEKLISQKQYDKKIADADADLAKKKSELDLKAFKRQQALALAAALINGALAITSTLSARPGLVDIFTFGVARAIEVGLVVAATAAQIASIASQAPPAAYGKGGLLENGPYHKDSERGLHVVDPRTGKTEMLLEKDEAVVKGSAMKDKKNYTVSGTPSQIASKLNAMHGGVNWAPGASINMPAFRKPGPQIRRDMPLIMEQGGLVRPLNKNAATWYDSQNSGSISLLQKINQVLEESNEIARNQKKQLHAVVSIKEFRDTAKQYDAAKRAGGISQ